MPLMCARCKLRAAMSQNPTPVPSRETGAAENASKPDTSPSSGRTKSHLWFCMNTCGKVADKRCVACKNHGVYTYYCGAECQKMAWKHGHKEVCGAKHADAKDAGNTRAGPSADEFSVNDFNKLFVNMMNKGAASIKTGKPVASDDGFNDQFMAFQKKMHLMSQVTPGRSSEKGSSETYRPCSGTRRKWRRKTGGVGRRRRARSRTRPRFGSREARKRVRRKRLRHWVIRSTVEGSVGTQPRDKEIPVSDTHARKRECLFTAPPAVRRPPSS